MGDNINDRSALYNNAGIRLMGYGNYPAALEMFRGALESKLMQERLQLCNNESAAADPNNQVMDEYSLEGQQRCVSPDSSDDSDMSSNTPMRTPQRNGNLDSFLDLLRNMDDQQRQNDQTPSTSVSTRDGMITPTNGISSPIISPSPSDASDAILPPFRGYEPYLYRIPFELPGCEMTSATQPSVALTQSLSCRIVFNLGLIHQTLCPTSCKVASFYEIAATLLSSLPAELVENSELAVISVRLRIAILNNFGVWCYENGEGESMMNSFEQLVDTLDEDEDLIDPDVVRGVRANFEAFLTPTSGASLAA